MWIQPPNGNMEFGGLWQFDGQEEVLDEELARMRFGLKARHGTYTKICYHRVVARSLTWEQANPGTAAGLAWARTDLNALLMRGAGDDNENVKKYKEFLSDAPADVNSPIPNMALDVFDEEGNFGHFVWNRDTQWGKGKDEIGAWEFRYDKISCTVNEDKDNPYLPNGDSLDLLSRLTLTPFSEKDAARFPRNGAKKNVPCPLPFVPPQSNPETHPPWQYIYYDSGEHQLVWVLPPSDSVSDEVKLFFTRQEPQPLCADAKVPGMDNWGNLFAQSTVQWEFPLAGWNPANLGSADPEHPNDFVYQKQGHPISHTGTPTGTFKRQSLAGKPIFAVPDPESADYVIAQRDTKVFLPLGAVYQYLDWEQEATTSDMLSSTADRLNSWGLTMGISAGIEKVLSASEKGSYHQKIQNQQEKETRYSVTRRVKRSYVLLTEVKNLRLDEDYKNAVLGNLKHLNEGDTPEWEDFVYNFGTHYAHVLTYGKTDFAETQYSFDAETYAYEQGVKIEESAEATLDGIKFGEEASATYDWGEKIGGKVSKENVTHTIIGSDKSDALIFLDLRPAWELFSPVFFPPGFDEFALDEEAVAPFIWHKLRESFREYLEEQIGVNGKLDASQFLSYSPIIVKVRPRDRLFRFPAHDSKNGSGWAESDSAVYAIGWEPTNGTQLVEWNNFGLPVRSGRDAKASQSSPGLVSPDILTSLFDPVEFSYWDPPFDRGQDMPGYKNLYCIMAVTPGALRKNAGFKFSMNTHYFKNGNDDPRSESYLLKSPGNYELEVLQGKDQYDSIVRAG